MGRKHIVNPFKMIDDGDMSGQILSTVSNALQLDQSQIRLEWSGTGLSGEFFVDSRASSSEDWIALDFGAQILVSSDSGSHDVIFTQMPFAEMRVRYEATSGTGSCDATLTMKTIGA